MKLYFSLSIVVLTFSLSLFTNTNPVHAQSSESFNAQIRVHKEVAHQISPYIWGVNGEALPDMTAKAFLAKYPAFGNLGIKMIRYPGGCFADGFDWKNHKVSFKGINGTTVTQNIMSIDEVLKLANILHAEILYVVDIRPEDGYTQGCVGGSMLYPDSLQSNLELLQTYKGQIHYYELGNEPYYWLKDSTPYPQQSYLSQAQQYAQIIKTIDPSTKVTLVNYQARFADYPLSAVSAMCGGLPCFDTVSNHPYYRSGYNVNEPISASNFPGRATMAVFSVLNPYFDHLNTVYGLSSFQPAKSLALTEYNVPCYGWGKGKVGLSQGTVDHGMYQLESLFQMITHNVTIANVHDLIHTQLSYRTGNCGLLEEDDKNLTPAAVTFQLSSPAAGGQLLRLDNNSPKLTTPNDSYNGTGTTTGAVAGIQIPALSAYTVISPNDGLLYAYLINKRNVPDAITTVQFDTNVEGIASANTAEITLLNSNAFTDRSFSKSTTTIPFTNPLSITVPARSIAMVKIYNSNPGPSNCNRCSIIHGCERTQFQSANSDCLTPNSGVTRTTDLSCPQISGGDNSRCAPISSLPGDLNKDGKVNIFDYNELVTKFGKPYTVTDYKNILENFWK